MNKPFELPDGVMWRAFDDRDRSWWCGDGKGSHPMGRGVPLDECASVSITYRLQHIETGEEWLVHDRWIPFHVREDKDDVLRGIAYQYTEGNFGCGCSRARFWADARGEDCDEDVACDQKWRITWPQWLAECDEEPHLRSEEPPPWRAA